MAKQPERAGLRELLINHGADLSTEAGQSVLRWLERDLAAGSLPDWEARLPNAIQLGLDIYWDFMTAFNAFYEEPEGKGTAHVAKALRNRCGQADPHMTEAVLDRIRNRRLHLLDSFRRKYQPSLFGPRAVDAKKIRGYLIRVANLESLHVPTSDLPWGAGRTVNLAALAEPAAPAHEAESLDPRRLAEALGAFWSRQNGFSAEQRLEGLTSLGLGFMTGVPEVEERCRALLVEKLPAWEENTTRLRRRASQWLARLEEVQRQANAASSPAERDHLQRRLGEIEDRLTRLRVRLNRQPARLRPRAVEVQRTLVEFVANVGNTRFRRIAREIALLEDRVRSGGAGLNRDFSDQLPHDPASLVEDVEAHLLSRPPSPRAHGLSVAERSDRVRLAAAWKDRAEELLARVRGHYRLFFSFPLAAPLNEAVLNWLADAEDLYEFGVLRRKGVTAGLGRRHGWRLERLLRDT
jgi:hypothetical protein